MSGSSTTSPRTDRSRSTTSALILFGQEAQDQLRPPDAFTSEGFRSAREVGADRVDVRRVPQTHLEVDGCRDPDDLRYVVEADVAALVVGDLDVHVDRYRRHRPDLREHRHR